MSDVRYGAFTVRVDCRSCGQPIPVNAPETSVHCDHCQADAQLPVEVWRAVLYDFDEHHDTAGADPVTKTAEVGGWVVHFTRRRAAPVCEKCGAAYPADRLAQRGDVDFFCVACGDPGSGYARPAWLSTPVRTATQIILTEPGGGRKAGSPLAVAEAPRPVLMQCPGCGGPLSITAESPRTTKCEHCKADIYLPDDLWRRLHPSKTMREWFVRFEGVTDRQKADAERYAAQAAADEAREKRQAQHREELAQRAVEGAARAAAEAVALESAVSSAKLRAYFAVLALGALIALMITMVLGTSALGLELEPAVFLVVAGLQFVAAVVAAYMTGMPIKLALRADGEQMMAYHWIWVIFSFFVFPFGPILLVVGVKRFFGTFAAATLKGGPSGRRYIDSAKLSKGESWPAGLFFLAMSLGVAAEIAAAQTFLGDAPNARPPATRRAR